MRKESAVVVVKEPNMPRKPASTMPPLTDARVRQFDAAIEPLTAGLDVKDRGRVAVRKLRRLNRRAAKKQEFIARTWAKYAEHCRKRGEAAVDWDAFLVWLKDFWAKYGQYIIQIAISLVFMFLGDEPDKPKAKGRRKR